MFDDPAFKRLANRINEGSLAGLAAQSLMSRSGRKLIPDDLLPDDPNRIREAGVLALFYRKNGDVHLLLTKRTNSNPNDKHAGQISFPGGKKELVDQNLADTAIRETHEEVGILPEKIQILGPATDLYIPVSNFMVSPFVGILNEEPVFQLEESEVEHVIEAPFDLFLDANSKKIKDIRIYNGMKIRDIPYFEILGHTVWGATAMIISELVEMSKP